MRVVSGLLVILCFAFPVLGHDDDDGRPPAVAATAVIHGGAGPFAVAGYRMGEAALETLGLKKGSFDLEVLHYSPKEVQWSCIIDGLQAATGASVGKLNLKLVPATAKQLHSVVRNRKTGEAVELRLTRSFLESELNVPPANLMLEGEKVAAMPAVEVFTLKKTK